MNNDKLGYEIYYVGASLTELTIKLVGEDWNLFIYKYEKSTLCKFVKKLKAVCFISEGGHKAIAELIEMPWEYYEKCLNEEDAHSVLLMTNVNHWLKDQGVLRLIHSIHVQRDKSEFKINLKEKI